MPRPARRAARVAAGAPTRCEPSRLSFCDFVDDALFHPRWGYYSSGGVRFGTGGHYDTYPLALSPLFGHMVAEYAFRSWRRAGTPARFEICEVGAGNGQLCLDTVLWTHERSRHDRGWHAFAAALRYRILERSPALVTRQRQQLGALADGVCWSRADLAHAVPRGAPFAACGLIVANEVLDCLPHHKIVPRGRSAAPAVAFVEAELAGRRLDRNALAAAMAAPARRRKVRFRERLRPLEVLPRLAAFVRRHHPELFAGGSAEPPRFICPRFETIFRHAARLYDGGDGLWIDYGETDGPRRRRAFGRVFAGRPRSKASVYGDPGRDDITFMVDFTLARASARDAGWQVAYCGPQAELARQARVRLDHRAVELIVRHRVLGWLLAVAGVGPERSWQRHGVTWSRAAAPGRVSVRRYVEQSVREFRGERASPFKLLITQR